MSTALSVKLVGPRSDALRLLRVHHERGKTLRQSIPAEPGGVGDWTAKKKDWVVDTADLLKRIFDQPTVAEGFVDTQGRFAAYPAEWPLAADVMAEEMELRVARLGVVIRRVEAGTEVTAASTAGSMAAKKDPGEILTAPAVELTQAVVAAAPAAGTVAIVAAGVDDGFVRDAREFLEKLGITPEVSPAEQLTTGATFALLLLSGEDAGCARPDSNQALRSDVAFDLGFLCGRVGAAKVAVLFPQGGESFTSGRGIPHIPLDGAGGWMLHLARQMKKAGVPVDMNRVL